METPHEDHDRDQRRPAAAAKQLAVQRNVSLKAIVESALREHLDEATQASRPRFKLRKPTFGRRELQSGLDENNWRRSGDDL